MKILCDNREKAVIKQLQKLGNEIEVVKLNVADFVLSGEDYAERKRGDDLVKSKRSGHLDEQVRRMREVTDRPIIILEDVDMAFNMKRPISGKKWKPVIVKPLELYGILASLVIKHNCTIIPTRDSEDTAILLDRLSFKAEELDRGLPDKRGRPKLSNLNEKQFYLLQGLPGIGATHVRAIMEVFDSPWKFFKEVGNTRITWFGKRGQSLKAPRFETENRVTKLPGFGPRTVYNIQKILWNEHDDILEDQK